MPYVLVLSLLFAQIQINVAFAQAPIAEKKPFRIAIVLWRGKTEIDDSFKAYFQMRSINVEFEEFNADSKNEALPNIMAQLKEKKPDLIFSWGTTVTEKLVGHHELFQANPTDYIHDIPVVFTIVSYPFDKIAIGEYSGRNITGSSHLPLSSHQLNTIKNYKKESIKRLGIIYNPKEDNSRVNVRELEDLTKEFMFTLIKRPVPLDEKGDPIPEMLPSLVENMVDEQVDVLYLGPDSFTAGKHRQVVTLTALWLKLMTFSSTESALEEDAYASIGLVSTYKSLGQFAGYQAEQILLYGKKPGEIPIEPLKRFTFMVNTPSINYIGDYAPLSMAGYANYQQRPEHLKIVEKLKNNIPLTFKLPQ